MKKILPILVFCSGVLVSTSALADFEFVELVVNVIKQIEANEQTVQRIKQTIETTKNKIAQGPLGSIISEIKKISAEDLLRPKNKQPTAVAEGLNSDDVKQVEEAYKSTIPNYEKDNQIPTSLAGEAISEEYLRTHLEQLYAYAFTLRTKMERDRQNEREDPVDLPEEGSRSINLLKDETLETSYRMSRLVYMDSALKELQIRLKLRSMYLDKDQE